MVNSSQNISFGYGKNCLDLKNKGFFSGQHKPPYSFSLIRSALPFGGFEKAAQLMTFQLPDIEASEEPEPAVVYHHDAHSRPCFNRTPIGWVGSGDTSNVHLLIDTMPFDGETDEL